ncbi:unnamed protein product, partial [Ilex paraguariensis]
IGALERERGLGGPMEVNLGGAKEEARLDSAKEADVRELGNANRGGPRMGSARDDARGLGDARARLGGARSDAEAKLGDARGDVRARLGGASDDSRAKLGSIMGDDAD